LSLHYLNQQRPIDDALRRSVMEDVPELADIDLRRKAVEAWAFRSAQAGRGSTLAGSVAPRASRSRVAARGQLS
jgi:hypothetical protein